MKKVEADCEGDLCSVILDPCPDPCACFPIEEFVGVCLPYYSVKMMAEKNVNLCLSHADCEKTGSGSFCARYPYSKVEYGWCFASKSHAQASFKIVFNSKFPNLFRKTPLPINVTY